MVLKSSINFMVYILSTNDKVFFNRYSREEEKLASLKATKNIRIKPFSTVTKKFLIVLFVLL
jgi:hypothetical protein